MSELATRTDAAKASGRKYLTDEWFVMMEDDIKELKAENLRLMQRNAILEHDIALLRERMAKGQQ